MINLDSLKGNEELLLAAEKSISEIGGINFKEGAARFANKRDKYIASLHKFAVTLDGESMTAFAEAIKPENSEETRRVVHTLKGTAANLSVESIHMAALEFEKTLKEGAPDEELYKSLTKDCEYVKEQMGARFAKGDDKGQGAVGGVSAADLSAYVKKLIKHLETSEAKQVEEIIALIKNADTPYKAEINEIARLVEDYDYFGAEDSARGLAEKL